MVADKNIKSHVIPPMIYVYIKSGRSFFPSGAATAQTKI